MIDVNLLDEEINKTLSFDIAVTSVTTKRSVIIKNTNKYSVSTNQLKDNSTSWS